MKLPSGLSALDAARIGTAGYTAMLCVDALVKGRLTWYLAKDYQIDQS